MNVTMPDGTNITGVPKTATKEQVLAKYEKMKKTAASQTLQNPSVPVMHPSHIQDISQIEPSFVATESPEEGYFDRVTGDMQKRYSKMQEIYNRTQGTDFRPGAQTLGQANIAGQAAGMVFDPVSEAIVSGWNTLAPDEFKSFISEQLGDFAQTELGKMGLNAFSEGLDKFNRLTEKIPEIGETFETLLNFSMLNLTKAARREALNSIDDFSTIAKKFELGVLPETAVGSVQLARQTSNHIRDTIKKVINIAGKGKETGSQKLRYLDRAEAAIKDIVDNKNSFNLIDLNRNLLPNKLPTNPKTAILDFAQVIGQRKRQLGPLIDDALAQADNAGLKISTKKAISNIKQLITSPEITSDPTRDGLVKAGRKMIERLKTLDGMPASTAHAKFIKPKVKAPKQPLNLIADPDAELLRFLRKEGIESSLGEVLSNSGKATLSKYGDLLNISSDVHKMFATAAKNETLSYEAIYTALELGRFATLGPHNPSSLGVARAVNRILQRLPEQRIARMFRMVEGDIAKQAKLAESISVQATEKSAGKAMAAATGVTTLTPLQQSLNQE